MTRFFKSFSYPFKGINYLFKNKSVRKYLIIPMTIDLILSIFLLVFLIMQIPELLGGLSGWMSGWVSAEDVWYLNILRWVIKAFVEILKVVGYLIVIIISPYIFIAISTVFDSIFRGFLYSKVKKNEGHPEPELPIKILLYRTLISLKNDLIKLSVYLLLSIILFLLNIIFGFIITPLISNAIYFTLQFILTAIFSTWEFLVYYFDEKKFSFKEQFRFIRKNMQITFGFGFPAALLLLIPIVQAFFLSTHTIGGALLSIELEKENQPIT
ncbi:MAG: hypothetical protein F6K39_43970 [Okeania sp. SIO3B3]|nr:hypothetical protein [Okeania sp. SIO3B3]